MKRKSLKRRIQQNPLLFTLVTTGVSVLSLVVVQSGATFSSVGGSVSHMFALFAVKGESVTASDTTYKPSDYPESPSNVSPSSAPEPASLMLMAPALVLLARRSRKA